MRWRPCLSLAIPCVLCANVLLSAQTWPTIPPIPLQERFRPRSDLAVTLKLEAAQLMAGNQPIVLLTIRNTGAKALRIWPSVAANSNARIRVLDNAKRQLHSQIFCSYQRVFTLASRGSGVI